MTSTSLTLKVSVKRGALLVSFTSEVNVGNKLDFLYLSLGLEAKIVKNFSLRNNITYSTLFTVLGLTTFAQP